MAINMGHVGFGAACFAGLILAVIGHPSPPDAPMLAAAPASSSFVLKSVSVELPASDVAFPAAAGAEAITANCLACHSAGMVLTQPALSKAAWQGVVEKMIHTYKAPIAARDVAAIVDYLSR